MIGGLKIPAETCFGYHKNVEIQKVGLIAESENRAIFHMDTDLKKISNQEGNIGRQRDRVDT